MESKSFKRKLRKNVLIFESFIHEADIILRSKGGKCNGLGMIASLIMPGKRDSGTRLANKIFTSILMEESILMVNTGRESIKLGPPLNINPNLIKQSLSKIIDHLKSI